MKKNNKPFKFNSESEYIDEMKKLSEQALHTEDDDERESLEKEYEKVADELMRFTNQDE